ncbi:MAG TPA: transcription antitermination factor NusB [Phycisphaerales bacterium]|nr:transcription antitermination factor NusB [Phycisphaerales bacterium]
MSTHHNDAVRVLAYHSAYRLPQTDEAPSTEVAAVLRNAEALEAALTPEERQRVANIAARRLAFQILYELDVSQPKDPRAAVEAMLAHVDGLGPIMGERVRDFALGAWENRKAADAVFAMLAPEWPTHRLAGVDRAILRLAHREIASRANPASIAINEAVELARAFGTEKSPAFINALVHKAAQSLGAPDAPPDGAP